MIQCTRQHFSQGSRALIRLYTAGAAEANASCDIYSDAQNPNNGHVVCDTATVLKADPAFLQSHHLRETIRTLRLDSLGLVAPDVLKIDVEGHEAAAFEGIVAMMDENPDRFKVIFTEFIPWMIHRKGYDPLQYLNVFYSRGYITYSEARMYPCEARASVPCMLTAEDIKVAIEMQISYGFTMFKSSFPRHLITNVSQAANFLLKMNTC